MFIFFPLFSLLILVLIFSKRGNDWRNSILLAALVWGMILTIITEILSIFTLLTFNWLLGLWVLVSLILAFNYLVILRRTKQPIQPSRNFKIKNTKLPLFLIFLLYSIAFIVAVVGLTALIAPPNNWDSMDYHMPRVVHWIQNYSVAHYPTNFLPQLYQKPWAEFTIMHFQILSGGDRFANLVQWLSMVGSIIGISLIAKQLGADLRGQVFSAVVVATIPMAILQGSSTQNDFVVSFWLVCFVYYVLLTLKEKISLVHSSKLGASLGLALLTKGTAYIYTLPFFILFFITGLKRFRWQFWNPLLVITFLVLVINIGDYTRNFELFGSPLAVGGDKYTNEIFSASVLLSNIIKNITLHIGTINLVNTGIIKVLHLIHPILGLDINDPRTTWGEFRIRPFSNHEDSAGNLIHLLLIFFTVIIVSTQKKLREQRDGDFVIYLVTTLGVFLLFCLLLKWQPFHSRLHLPIFVLFSAFVGVVLSKITNKAANRIAIILILSALPWVIFNSSRPLLFSMDRQEFVKNGNVTFTSKNLWNTSRIEQYFNNRPELESPYTEAVDFVKNKGCSDIGLAMENWEYPFWVLLQKGNKDTHLEHVNVKNISDVLSYKYPYNKFNPCVIISVDFSKGKERQQEKIVTHKGSYVREWFVNPVTVLFKR
jgi:hypothetical protein